MPCSLIGLSLLASPLAAENRFSWRDGLRVDITDNVQFSTGARMQYDLVRFNDDRTRLDDDQDFRRLRLINRLAVFNWRVRADHDFGVSEGWKNLYVQYRGLDKQLITFGNQTAPFSKEDTIGSGELPFLERSIASALSPGTLVGLSYRRWGDRWSTTAGLFGNELNDLDRRRLRGRSINARATFAPLRTDLATLHLGFSTELRKVSANQSVRLRVRPGTRLTTRRLIDTRRIRGVDRSYTNGIELGLAYRNLRVQTEAIRLSLDRDTDHVDLKSHKMMASVLLGGARYRYSVGRGSFYSVPPKNRWGALELAARHARLDLDDGPVEGGIQTENTLGVSWIINQQLRTTLNYTDIEAKPNRNGRDEDVSLWSLRLQYSF